MVEINRRAGSRVDVFEWLEQRLRAARELTDAMDGVNFVGDLRGPAKSEAIQQCEAALEQVLPDRWALFSRRM